MTTNKKKASNYYTGANVKNKNKNKVAAPAKPTAAKKASGTSKRR